MHLSTKLTTWLETHWVAPAYAGWVISGLTIFFLLAATNTLAGWLYVLGGLGLGLLIVAAVLSIQSLQGLQIKRLPTVPVSVGESLTLGLQISNLTPTTKALLQVIDRPPTSLGIANPQTLSEIAANSTHICTYVLTPQQRGVYRWQTVYLRSAAPLGLFWCQRHHLTKAKAIIYPQVLPLQYCPLLEQVGQDQDRQFQSQHISPRNHYEGITRSIRPYRRGDPLRLVHWRTSARHNELRTRELEMFTGGQALTIALDSSSDWHPDHFEQAVIATASFYVYGQQYQDQIQVWTGQAGLQTGRQAILETLAQVQADDVAVAPLPQSPVLWLSPNADSLSELPPGSFWLLWFDGVMSQPIVSGNTPIPGLRILPDQPLLTQLQQDISSPSH